MNARPAPLSSQRIRRWSLCFFVGGAAAFSIRTPARAEEIEAVASRVSADYVRAKRPDGSFVPETYAFGQGGYWSGGSRDPSIDGIKFMAVARTIAGPLGLQSYVPTRDAATTKLLIMVYWGATNPPARAGDTIEFQTAAAAFAALQQAKMAAGGATTASGGIQAARGTQPGPPDQENAADAAIAALQAQNAIRRRLDAQNARMLGYDSWWSSTAHLEGTPLDGRWHDMLDELEDGRYFVVLMAYDFQLMWKQKKPKLLWETRFSIRQQHHEFDQALPAMVDYASKYFGQDSHGLQHRDVPLGKVELGELKSLGPPAEK